MGRRNRTADVGRVTYGKARLFIPPPPTVRGAEVVPAPAPTVEPSPRVVEPGPRRRPSLDSVAVAAVLNGPGVSVGTVKVRASTPARKLRLRVYLMDEGAAHAAARTLGTVARPAPRVPGAWRIRAEGERARVLLDTAAHLLDAAVVERVLFALKQVEESRVLAGDR